MTKGCAFCVRQGKLKDPPLPWPLQLPIPPSNIQQAIPQVLFGLLGRGLIQTLGFTSTSSVAPISSTLAPSTQPYSYTTPRHTAQLNTTHSLPTMKIPQLLTYIALASSAANAASLPSTDALSILEGQSSNAPRSSDIFAPEHALERRKGGGGRGGGGSSGGSSGGRTGGSSSGGSPGRTSPSSNTGGATRSGSGPPRTFGGGGYYGGGAAVPYRAGGKTPKGLIAGALIAPVVLLAVMPGLWLASVYPYHYNNPYRFNNETETNATNPNGTDTTLPVLCLCQENNPCGCDENSDTKYINDLVGNGSYPALNKTLVTVADVNGTRTLVLNGTLPDGTTAPGGTDDESAAMSLYVGKLAGYWAMGVMVVSAVLL
jgi:hypothetical protein